MPLSHEVESMFGVLARGDLAILCDMNARSKTQLVCICNTPSHDNCVRVRQVHQSQSD